jgi:hypothetical protein
MNSKVSKTENQWQPCDQGLIQDANESIRGVRLQHSRRQFLRKASAAAVVVAGAGFVGWSLMKQDDPLRALHGNPNYPGGIACSEVLRLLPDYVTGSIDDLKLVSSIDEHIAECRHCSGKHEAMVEVA